MLFHKKNKSSVTADNINNPDAESDFAPSEGAYFAQPSDSLSGRKFPGKKILIAGIAAIILLCGAAFGIFKLIQSLDYMRPVKNICSIYNSRKTEPSALYKSCYGGAEQKQIASVYKILASSDAYNGFFSDIGTEIEAYYRNNAATSGSGIKMSFDTTGDKTRMDESRLASFSMLFYSENVQRHKDIYDSIDSMSKNDWQRVADKLGITLKNAQSLGTIIQKRCLSYINYNISAGFYITGRFVLTNDEGKTIAKTDKITLTIIKLNGEWYLYDGKDDGLFFATGSMAFTDTDIIWDVYDKYIK